MEKIKPKNRARRSPGLKAIFRTENPSGPALVAGPDIEPKFTKFLYSQGRLREKLNRVMINNLKNGPRFNLAINSGNKNSASKGITDVTLIPVATAKASPANK